jgi:hypothetical protein
MELFPQLKWAGDVATPEVLSMWESEGVQMRIPRGAEYINPSHFSGMFVFHSASRVLFVDDTLMLFDGATVGCMTGCLLGCAGMLDKVLFHTTTFDGTGLYCRESAAGEFRAFMEGVLADWDFDAASFAHKAVLTSGAKAAVADALRRNLPSFAAYTAKYKGRV